MRPVTIDRRAGHGGGGHPQLFRKLTLFLRKAAFLRTPKTSEETRWWEALRSNWAESALALLGFIGIGAALTKATQLSGPLLAVLLLFPTLGCGPLQQLGCPPRPVASLAPRPPPY